VSAAPRRTNLVWYAALLAAAALWGIAFVPQRSAMEHTGPHTFNFLRFGGGFAALAAVIGFRRLGAFVRRSARSVLLLGALLFLGSFFQQAGMVTSPAGQGGFITGLYLVFIPLFLAWIWRERISWNCWAGALLALVGLALLTLSDTLSFSTGDAWLFACAIAFSFHVIAVGKAAPNADTLSLAAGQFAVCALLSGAAGAAFEQHTWFTTWRAYPEVLYMIFGSIGIGYTLQVVAQGHVPAANAGVVMSLESVFAEAAGYALLGEALSGRQLLGCALMFSGMLLAQLHDLRRTRAKMPEEEEIRRAALFD